jgi:S1/P1 Nuclease
VRIGPRFGFLLFVVLAFLLHAPTARAWGCKGHETVALIAEAHLTPAAKALAYKILAAGPIDPTLSRYCKEPNLDAFADASTWADDERQIKPETAPWHFIDIPRGAPESLLSQFCPPATGCITSALAAQIEILRDPNAPPQSRADALRYVIHFVGDIHQPLHDTTNNDQGGNCVPVTFFGKAPQERNTATESYSPNLHAVWDTNIIDQLSASDTPEQLAQKLDAQFATTETNWSREPLDFNSWAWQSHQQAESTVYGRLPEKIAIEKPQPIASCADDDHVSKRLLQLNEDLENDYQSVAAPVVEEQLAKAGLRLAALLNSILR